MENKKSLKKSLNVNECVFLSREDIMELTGWGKSTVDKLFAYDPESTFPVLRVGKTFLVSSTAFIDWTKTKRSI